MQKQCFLALFCFLWTVGFSLNGQQNGTYKVQILSAKSLKPGKSKNHQKLVGNVVLQQEDMKLYCDSAEINQSTNDFYAWGKVFVNKQDSIKAWGDSLKYDGTIEKAKLVGNAKLTKGKTVLKTDVLYLDQKNDVFYYLTPARIVSEESIITSGIGYYYSNESKMTFRKEVVVTHPDYTIEADTLDYFSNQEKVVFQGPTNIFLKEERVYCERGFYLPNNQNGEFRQNAKIEKEENTLLGDSIVVDQEKEISKAFGKVVLIDTINKVNIKGEYAFFDQRKGSTFVTDSALFIQFLEEDTLYLHGDTIFAQEDSASEKSFLVDNNVRLFKQDMQAVCDSLSYSFSDSLIKLFDVPVVWNGASQLTGDTISILTYDNELHNMYINGNSMIVSLTDSAYGYYDQIKGRKMIGHFKQGKMDQMDVLGNGQTLYYAKEDSSYTGVNKAECSNIKIKFSQNEISKIVFLSAPEAVFYPLKDFPMSEAKMEGFLWKDTLRPKCQSDVFLKNQSIIEVK